MNSLLGSNIRYLVTFRIDSIQIGLNSSWQTKYHIYLYLALRKITQKLTHYTAMKNLNMKIWTTRNFWETTQVFKTLFNFSFEISRWKRIWICITIIFTIFLRPWAYEKISKPGMTATLSIIPHATMTFRITIKMPHSA
jgi:hypothetical protein